MNPASMKLTIYLNFRKEYWPILPGVKCVQNWYDKVKDTGSVDGCKRSGSPSSSYDNIDAVRTAFTGLHMHVNKKF